MSNITVKQKYNVKQCNTTQQNTTLYTAIQFNMVQCSTTVQYDT